jgi:hypothetical protein
MELEDALFKWVSTQATVTSHIGAAPAQVRFYKGKAPQGVKTPFMIQQRNGAERQHLQCGIDGAVPVSIQIDTYAKDWAAMAACARALERALRPGTATFPIWMGDGDSPAVAVKVKAAICENEFDGEDPDPGLSRRTQLWTFWIWEP